MNPALQTAIQAGHLYAELLDAENAYLYYAPGQDSYHVSLYTKAQGRWLHSGDYYGDLRAALASLVGEHAEVLALDALGLHDDPITPPTLPISVIRRPPAPTFTQPTKEPSVESDTSPYIVTNPTFAIPAHKKNITYPSWVFGLVPFWLGAGGLILYCASIGSFSSLFFFLGIFMALSNAILYGAHKARKDHEKNTL